MLKRRNKRGFTLVELSISLTVTVILLVMISTVIANIINTSKKVNRENALYADLYLSEMFIKTYVNGFMGYEEGGTNYEFATVLPSVVNAGNFITDPEQSEYLAVYKSGVDTSGEFVPYAVLSFDKQSRSIISTDRFSRLYLANVDDILFYKKDDAIRVLVYYGGSYNPLVIMLACREVV